MREAIWLYLRNSAVGRRLRENQKAARAFHRLGCLFLPAVCRVRSGPSAGLLLESSPHWPADMWQGNYEPTAQVMVDHLLGPGSVFYDVGGGIGLYSLLAARKGASVFVFEPHPANASAIARHAKLNGCEGSIRILAMAVSSKTGPLTMALVNRDSQMVPLDTRGSSKKLKREVLGTTLDDFAHFHPAPTLVKVDVEGAETDVLKGAAELFGRVRPKLICEVHSAENAERVVRWLRDKGYSVRWLEGVGHERHIFAEPDSTSRHEPHEADPHKLC